MYYLFDIASQNRRYGSMMTTMPPSSQSRATVAATNQAAAAAEATTHNHTEGGLGNGRLRNNNNSTVKPKKKRNKKKKKKTLFDDDEDDDDGDKNHDDDEDDDYDSVRGENLLLLEPTLPPTTTTNPRRLGQDQDPYHDLYQHQRHQHGQDKEEQFLLDIDEAIQRIGFGPVQVHTIVATGLLFVCDSMEIVLLSYLSNVAEGKFFDYNDNDDDGGSGNAGGGGMSAAGTTTTTSEAVVETVLEDTFGTVDGTDADDDGSDPLLRTAVFPAAIAGAILFGILGDLYGRRIVLVGTSVIVAVFGIVTSFVNTFQMLVLTRCAVSFGIGGMTVGFDLCAELLPPNKRGKYLAMIQIFWTVGALIAHLTLKFHHHKDDTGYDDNNVEFDGDNNDDNNDIDNGWRWIAGMFAIPGVLSFLVTVLLVPESPRWYLAKGRHDDALSILRKAAEVNKKDPFIVFPDGVILFSHEYSQQHYRYSDLRFYNHDNSNNDQNNTDRSVWSSFSTYVSSCWSKSSLSQIFNLCSAGWMSITAALWTTYFGKAFLEHGSVSMAVDVFSYDDRQQEYQAVFTATSEFVGLCLVICLVDRWGRSMTQMICYALSGILCLSLALFEDYDPSVNPNLLLGLVFFSHLLVHSGTITTWIATTEVLATTIRTTGHGTAHAFTRIGGALSTFILSRIYSIPTVGLILFVTALWTASSASKLPETKVKDMGAVHYPDPSRSRRRRRRQRRQQQQRQEVNTPTT